MSTSNDATISTPVTTNTLSSSVFKNMYMIAEIIVFSITTFYFYRKINSLNYQLKEMDTKIQQLEKTIAEQKTFITDKMAEMSSIVTNMLRQQSRPPVYTQQPVYQPQQINTQPVQTQVQQNFAQQPVYQPQQTSTQPLYVQTPVHVQTPVQNFTQNQGYGQPQTQPVQQFVPQNNTQQTPPPPPQQTVQTLSPPKQNNTQSPSQQNNAPYIPFEVIMVDMSATPNANVNNTKMTIEEDEDDELDRELSAELDELKE